MQPALSVYAQLWQCPLSACLCVSGICSDLLLAKPAKGKWQLHPRALSWASVARLEWSQAGPLPHLTPEIGNNSGNALTWFLGEISLDRSQQPILPL